MDFRRVSLTPPLVLSGGSIDSFTLAEVAVSVRDRSGGTATGRGQSILSVPWAWPRSPLPVSDRDAALRGLCRRLAAAAVGQAPADPLRLWRALETQLPPDLPRLAGLLSLGAVDNALHDGWARAAGRPASTMYDGRHLNDDLAADFGPQWTGSYPGAALRRRPHRALPVQHLVGAGDPLDPEAADSPAWWCRRDGVAYFKVKVLGHDPAADAARVCAVFTTVSEQLAAPPVLAVDPNEGCESAAAVSELMAEIRARNAAAARAIAYLEQPVPRDQPFLTARPLGIPVLLDEGSVGVESLRTLDERGWDGVVIKAGKGQSLALLAHSYAVRHRLFRTVQDLTAVDLALAHSARLASSFDLSSNHLEYNSRQYAPAANERLASVQPELAQVRRGTVMLAPPSRPGLY